VITTASHEDLPITVDAVTFEDQVHHAYRPQNLQSIEGPRLYQIDFLPGLKAEDSRAHAAGFLRTCSGCVRGFLSPSTPVCPTVRSVWMPADRMFFDALRSAFSA